MLVIVVHCVLSTVYCQEQYEGVYVAMEDPDTYVGVSWNGDSPATFDVISIDDNYVISTIGTVSESGLTDFLSNAFGGNYIQDTSFAITGADPNQEVAAIGFGVESEADFRWGYLYSNDEMSLTVNFNGVVYGDLSGQPDTDQAVETINDSLDAIGDYLDALGVLSDDTMESFDELMEDLDYLEPGWEEGIDLDSIWFQDPYDPLLFYFYEDDDDYFWYEFWDDFRWDWMDEYWNT